MIKDTNIRNFYKNFHQEDGFRVAFTAYEGKMMKKVVLASLALHDTYSSFAFHTQ